MGPQKFHDFMVEKRMPDLCHVVCAVDNSSLYSRVRHSRPANVYPQFLSAGVAGKMDRALTLSMRNCFDSMQYFRRQQQMFENLQCRKYLARQHTSQFGCAAVGWPSCDAWGNTSGVSVCLQTPALSVGTRGVVTPRNSHLIVYLKTSWIYTFPISVVLYVEFVVHYNL